MEVLLLIWLGTLVIVSIVALIILHEIKTYCKKIRKNLDVNTEYLKEVITNTFESSLGLDLSAIINQKGEDVTDGECLDEIVEYLKGHNLYHEGT
jgi:NDP-sugar pyrophosphorylase family protein